MWMRSSRKINGVIEKAYEEDKDIREEIKKLVPEYREEKNGNLTGI